MLPVAVGSALAIAEAVKVVRNTGRAQRPPEHPPTVTETVSVLVPARNEAHRITPTVLSLLAQTGVPNLEILILDDDSTDGTGDLVLGLANGDPRLRVLKGRPLAEGWKGKPHACMQLAEAATGSVLVFVDADVEFAPHAMAASVTQLRAAKLGLLSPFPRQVMGSPTERLYQPLVNWTLMATMAPEIDPETGLPPTVVANGQFLVFDAEAYRAAGGHAAVKQAVLDDGGMLFAVLGSGGKAAAVDGTGLAACRMYSGAGELVDGYTKWLCEWVNSSRKVVEISGAVALLQLLPAAAALRGSKVGLAGYLGVAAARVTLARRFGEPPFPYSFTHPVASVVSVGLIVESRRRQKHNLRSWKGRSV
jgi:hypothetical protein